MGMDFKRSVPAAPVRNTTPKGARYRKCASLLFLPRLYDIDAIVFYKEGAQLNSCSCLTGFYGIVAQLVRAGGS